MNPDATHLMGVVHHAVYLMWAFGSVAYVVCDWLGQRVARRWLG